jgi:hypothetical protein
LPVQLVWARGPVFTERCPRTEITAASQSWLELFAVWKRLGNEVPMSLPAKDAEALALLEEEWEKERDDEARRKRDAE